MRPAMNLTSGEYATTSRSRARSSRSCGCELAQLDRLDVDLHHGPLAGTLVLYALGWARSYSRRNRDGSTRV